MIPAHERSAYRPEIDGLRALAVVAVIINHFNLDLLPSGYLGVDIFFVISGYVITYSLARSRDESLRDFLLGFYVRRFKRLIPALVLFVMTAGFLICLFHVTPKVSLRTGIASLFGLSNLYLFRQSTDYFADSTELNVFAHTWSLGVEEQFYFVFPMLFWLFAVHRAKGRSARELFWVMTLLSAASIFCFVFLYKINQPAAYFLMPARLWELGAGCMAYLIAGHSRTPEGMFANLPSLFAAAGVLAVLFIPQEFGVVATILIVLLTATLIVCRRPGTIPYGIFTQRQVVYVGLISYSLYLWHWGVLSLSRWTTGVEWWTAPLLVALMLSFAILSFHFVEEPLRHRKWSETRIASVGYGASASVIAAMFLFVLQAPPGGYFYLGRLLNVAHPFHIERTWWTDKRTGAYLEKCHLSSEFSTRILKECLATARGQRGTIYLIGDSFARNYLPAAKAAFRDHAVAYLTVGGGCAFLPPGLASEAAKYRCSDYAAETAKFLLENVRLGDFVFVGQNVTEDRTTASYINFIKSFAAELGTKAVKLVLLDGTVAPSLTPEECLDVPWRIVKSRGCYLEVHEVEAALSQFDRVAQEASEQVPNLYYAPLRLGLCDGDVCGQTTARGTPIWHDRGHITEQAAEELAPLLRMRLDKLKSLIEQ